MKFIIQNIEAFLTGLFCFSLCFNGFNDFFRIANSVIGFFIMYKYWRNIVAEIRNIPLMIRMAYIIFGAGMVVASLVSGDNSDVVRACDYFRYSLPLLMGFLLARGKNIKQGVLFSFIISLLLISSYGLFDYFFYERKRLISVYGHPNLAATYLDIILPFVLIYSLEHARGKSNKYGNMILWIIGLIGIVSLFLTGSRGAVLGITIAVLFSMFIYGVKHLDRRKFIVGIMMAMIIATTSLFSLCTINNQKFSRSYDGERLLLIESSYNMWSDNKLFGVGLTNWKKEYVSKYILPNAKEPNLVQPHNIIAYYFSTTGLIGGGSFLVFVLCIFYYLYRNLNSVSDDGLICIAMMIAFIAIMLHGLVDIGIVRKEFFRLFSGCLGITIAMISKDKQY